MTVKCFYRYLNITSSPIPCFYFSIKMISLRIAVLLFCLSKAFAQFNCEDHKICSDCIQQFGCSWCLQPKVRILKYFA